MKNKITRKILVINTNTRNIVTSNVTSSSRPQTRQVPTAQEQNHDQKRAGDHVQEFRDQKQQQLDARVLRVIAAHQLLLAFRQVER